MAWIQPKQRGKHDPYFHATQALEIADYRAELSAEELRVAAERARARLERECQIDAVGDQQGVGADAAPSFDTLVGKTLEIRWRYYAPTDDGGKPTLVPNPNLHS